MKFVLSCLILSESNDFPKTGQQFIFLQQDTIRAVLLDHHLHLSLSDGQQADPLQPDCAGGGGGVPDVLPLHLLLHVPPLHPPVPGKDPDQLRQHQIAWQWLLETGIFFQNTMLEFFYIEGTFE